MSCVLWAVACALMVGSSINWDLGFGVYCGLMAVQAAMNGGKE